MASYQTTVTLAAPASGDVLLPNGSTVVTIGLDVGAQAAVAALMGNYVPQSQAANFAVSNPVALDTDGVYYSASSAGLAVDTDGTTFYAPSNAAARVVLDTDGVPYPVAIGA